MRICAVVLEDATCSYDKIFHYQVPAEMEGALDTGMRVRVPFGPANAHRTAYFLDYVNTTGQKKLKTLISVIDRESILSRDMFLLVQMIRDKYFATYGQILRAIIPPGLKVKYQTRVVYPDGISMLLGEFLESIRGDLDTFRSMLSEGQITLAEEIIPGIHGKTLQHVRLCTEAFQALEMVRGGHISGKKQIQLITLLAEYGEISLNDLEHYEGVSRLTVRSLENVGLVEVFRKEVAPVSEPMDDPEITFHPRLLDGQKQAVEVISSAMDARIHQRFLLHGVAGSGKTEVYLQLAAKTLEKGRDVIVLVPEIALTPLMIRRFAGRFGDQVAVLHSRMTMGQRLNQWNRLRRGMARIALGARSCVFAPVKDPGLVVVDEEHDPSYCSESAPRYDTRDVAAMRCALSDGVLVLGSATPSVETYYHLKSERRILVMEERAGEAEKPAVILADMRRELKEGNRGIFSRILRDEMAANLSRGEQTMLFLNRRGYSIFFLCRTCGMAVMCNRCDVTLTYHKKRNQLICHTCGYTEKPVSRCPSCQSVLIKEVGIGTQRVEEEVRKRFPEAKVMRMDLDTTSYRNAHEEILNRFRKEHVDILVGTQMIAKGHDFPDVTLMGILLADTLAPENHYHSQERVYQLLAQAIGRSGRGEKQGRAVIQAYHVQSHAIQAAMEQNYEAFYQTELTMRRHLNYPPFGAVSSLVFSGKDGAKVREWADKSRDILLRESVEVSDVMPDPVARIRSDYRFRLVLKSPSPATLLEVLKRFHAYGVHALPREVLLSIDTEGLAMICQGSPGFSTPVRHDMINKK